MTVNEPPCFAFLGLRPDSDERSVKRAYAQLLRKSRPDEDPSAFQVLHENYQQALAFLAWRAQQAARAHANEEESVNRRETATTAREPQPHEEDPQSSEVAAPSAQPAEQPHAAHAQTSSTDGSERAFDPAVFYVEMLREAGALDAEQFADWLRAQPALWSFELKAEVGARVLHQLFQDAPPMGEAQFDALLAFFDLDHVFAVRDPLAVDNLRDAMATRRDLNDANPLMLEIRMKRVGSFHGSETTRIMSELKRPWSRRRALLRALLPGTAKPYARFLRIASRGHLGLLTPPLDPRWPRFWVDAAGGFGVTRLVVGLGLARCIILTLMMFALSLLGTLSDSPVQAEKIWTSAAWFSVAGAVLCGLWLAWLGVRLAVAWQGLGQNDAPGWEKWLRLAFVPLLSLAAGALADQVAVVQSGLFSLVALTFSATALFIAIRRYRLRAHSPPVRWNIDLRLIIVPILVVGKVAGLLIQPQDSASRADDAMLLGILCFILTGVALVVWLADLWKQRHGLRARPAIA